MRRHTKGRTLSLVSGAAIGAGVMYFADPDRGNRRRSFVRHKIFHWFCLLGDVTDKGICDMQNLPQGVAGEAWWSPGMRLLLTGKIVAAMLLTRAVSSLPLSRFFRLVRRDQPFDNAYSRSREVEIPPAEWIAFFNSFSRQHERGLVSVSVKHGEQQQWRLRDRELAGISSDHLTAGDVIYIFIDHQNGGDLTHQIKNPMKVIFRQDLEEAHEGIDITEANGTVTSLRF